MSATTSRPPRAALALAALLAFLGLLGAPALAAASWLGDGGHFLHHRPVIHINNPEGRAFTVTMHRHVWPVRWGNKGAYELWLTGPDGGEVARGTIPEGEAEATLEAPAGAAGVYTLRHRPSGYSLTWVECSLPQMVVAQGPWRPGADDRGAEAEETRWPYGTLILHVMAPRRWYFYVPPGVREFRVKHTVFPFQSHREDYGFLVMNPRGQRVEALYGGKPLAVGREEPNREQAVVRTVETDAGTTGRFWSIWATGGDSHNFSDLQILLDGVPPYLASAPEQWFHPETGRAPPRRRYDESEIRLLDEKGPKAESGEILSRDHYLWTPTPFLGDEDYNGMRGPHTVYLANPAGRRLDVGVGSYIVPREERLPVTYTVHPPSGRRFTREDSYGHRASSRLRLPPLGKGVYRLEVDAPQWFFWSEPAVPMVLAGREKNGWQRFALEIGVARHWFFRVPEGTESFRLRLAVENPDHVLDARLHAPDRLLEMLYARGGEPLERRVTVPPGLDGHVWFLRLGVGSATRFLSTDVTDPQHLRINLTLELRGVPGYLAPTWGQWFRPTPD